MNGKSVDNRWGQAGVPLLPRSLREAWKGEPLPEWVAAELRLPIGSNLNALDRPIWAASGSSTVTDRQRNFLLNLVSSRRSEIQQFRVFTQPLPYWFDLKVIPLSNRTRNCLVTGNLFGETERLSGLTFGDLFKIPAMGVVSIIEFACVIEAALENSTGGPADARAALKDSEVLDIVAEPWVDQVGPADPRFSDLLPSLPQATVLEILEALTSGPDTDASALAQVANGIPELRKRMSKVAEMPLEDQLGEFLRMLSGFEGERLRMLIDRFGWNGKAPITLEEAGNRLGITRERVRQLQEKVSNRLRAISFPVYMPGLDLALSALVSAGPIRADAAAALLKERGISRGDFRPECVIAAATTCARKPPIQVQTLKGKTLVAATALPFADATLRLAYRQAHASGASNIGELVAEMAANGMTIDDVAVRRTLSDFSEVQFLDGDWFCHRPANPERDRLRNTTRKMLSVASPIELGVIREGIRREYRYRGHRGVNGWSLIVPPRAVLQAYYEAHPEFSVDNGDMVKSVQPLDYRTELALNDVILVDTLRSSPACVLDRSSFAAECARRSMNLNTFSIYLSYSVIIVRLGMDVWSLRGVRVDPAAVEAVREASALRPREKRVLDHGWTQDGHLWLAARIPAAHDAANMVVGVPAAVRPYLSRRDFSATDEDNVAYGSIRINDEGSSWGFGKFLRQRGADEGDILIMEFDLTRNLAKLRLGDDELLEEMSPEA